MLIESGLVRSKKSGPLGIGHDRAAGVGVGGEIGIEGAVVVVRIVITERAVVIAAVTAIETGSEGIDLGRGTAVGAMTLATGIAVGDLDPSRFLFYRILLDLCHHHFDFSFAAF